jgi:uncharacterized coiled-coil DUF342 family protein
MPASNPSNDPVVQIMMGMFDMIERYRKESDALQEMLLRRGLKRRQLRKEMNEILGHPKPLSRAHQQFRELCEGMRVFLEQNQANQALLAEIPVLGKPQ